MQQLVECVPNFSEGRNPLIIEAIVNAINAVKGTQILDVSSDPDHNRTVVTFVGSPDVVEEGAFRAIALAKTLINLDNHKGEHPRLGATDVVPFIPIRGVSIADCKAIAYRLGERVGRELEICVYYYNQAAKSPQRTNLPDIRRGEYELWKEEIGRNPAREPDEGPAIPATWGATIIGVRQFMAAYNLFLTTNNVGIAEAIAEAVRGASGGFEFVQAKGFLVEGHAQVSMNFHHLERSPLHRVTETVRREAARYGVAITRAELIGLIPQSALIEAAKWYLQLDIPNKAIIDYQLETPAAPDFSLNDFVEATASGTPTPGGGSVAALVGALGGALTAMVMGLTVGRKAYASVQKEAEQIKKSADTLRLQLMNAIDQDINAFNQLMETFKRKGVADEERIAQQQAALIHAGEVPLQIARLSRDVAKLALQAVRIGNKNAITDGAAAAYMAEAAVRTAALNVRINAKQITETTRTEAWLREIESLESELSALVAATTMQAAQRGGY